MVSRISTYTIVSCDVSSIFSTLSPTPLRLVSINNFFWIFSLPFLNTLHLIIAGHADSYCVQTIVPHMYTLSEVTGAAPTTLLCPAPPFGYVC